MSTNMKKWLILPWCIACAGSLCAHDFEHAYKSNVIYYNFISSEQNTVEVTYNEAQSGFSNSYKGNVEIPASVEYNGTTYTVTCIGKYAFYECDELTSLSLPPTIKRILSDFYGDKRLEKVSVNSHIYSACDMNSHKDVPYTNEVMALLAKQKAPIMKDVEIDSVTPYNKYTDLAAAEKNGKWGIIDRMGNVIIPFVYDGFEEMDMVGVDYKKKYIYTYAAMMESGGKWGVVDLHNEVLVHFTYDSKYDCSIKSTDKKIGREIKRGISRGVDYTEVMQRIYGATFECGAYLKDEMDHATPEMENRRWGIASNGKWLTMPKYDSCVKIEGKNRFLVSLNNKYGLIDNNGHSVIFDCIYGFMDVHGLRTLMKDGKSTVILNKGNYIIDSNDRPVFFDNVMYAGQDENLSPVFYINENNKWGLLSAENGVLVDCVFDAIGPFDNGTADTYYCKYKGSIGLNGNEVNSIAKAMYEEACRMSDSNFNDKLALYNATVKLDEFFDEGYAARCDNNIGVMYFCTENYTSAIPYFEAAVKLDPNVALYAKNLKNAKSNMRLDRLSKALNIVSGALNNMAAVQNGNPNGSANMNITEEPTANTGNYEARYRLWQNFAQDQFNSLRNAQKRPANGSNLLLMQTLKKNLSNAQRNMAQIRSQATSHNVTIQESSYESMNF